jgi:hypothetical protein
MRIDDEFIRDAGAEVFVAFRRTFPVLTLDDTPERMTILAGWAAFK